MERIVVTGTSGLVGSEFKKRSPNSVGLMTLGRRSCDINTNLLDKDTILTLIRSLKADVVVNFAAYTNVDAAESQKGQKDAETYLLNSLFPMWLAQACEESGKKLVHISTDYVFDGKQEDRPYKEDDSALPLDSWYAISKYEGEQRVIDQFKMPNFIIARISFPFSATYERKLDIARAVITTLKSSKTYFGISDQKIKPTSTQDIAKAIWTLVEKNASGIFHIAGSYEEGYITPYSFALQIAQALGFNPNFIEPISFSNFSQTRKAARPQHTWLDTAKIEAQGIEIPPFHEVLTDFKHRLQKRD